MRTEIVPRLSWVVALVLVVAAAAVPVAAQTKLTIARPDWGVSPFGLALTELEDRFRQMHPDIELEVVVMTDPVGATGGEGLYIQIAAGMVPDVVMTADTTLGELAALGALTDVTPYVVRDQIGEGTFWPAGWNAVTVGGRIYGLPYVTDSRAMIYNRQLFEEAGLAGVPERLEEFDTQIVQRLTRQDSSGAIDRLAFWPGHGNWWLWGWGWLFGGEFMTEDLSQVTANDPRIVEALEYEVSYVHRFGMPTKEYSLCSGTLAAEINVGPQVAHLAGACPEITFGVAPVPYPSQGGPSTWSGVWTYVIPNGADNPDLAWEYLKYISGAQAQEYFSIMTTSVPTHIDAASLVAEHLIQEYGSDASVFFDTMAFSRTRPLSPIANRYWGILEEYRQKAYRLEMTPVQALDEVTRVLQAEM